MAAAESEPDHGSMAGIVAEQTARPRIRYRSIHERRGDCLRGALPDAGALSARGRRVSIEKMASARRRTGRPLT